jgi:outer membrane protein OmpA-like peptidoglycan-associated protein
MKKLICISLCVLLLVKYTRAQEQLSVKQQADDLYERYEYFKSLTLYLKLVKKDKTDVKVLERIAGCYFNINRYEDAEKWYARAVADPKASIVSHYYYAEVLLRDERFDEAKQQYKLYFLNDPGELAARLATCDSAAVWMKQPSAYHIKNDSVFNTAYSDWGAIPDGKTTLIFTSDRISDGGNADNRTGNNWFNLYEADTKSNEVKELALATASTDIFNDEYHIGPIALNNTADTAYITVTTGISKKQLPVDKKEGRSTRNLYSRRLQLLIAAKKDGQWVVFGSFPYNNVQQYSVGDAALSKNGRVIYFTSDMPGGEGKTDIWYCEKRKDGSWGNPINCGKTINTKEEEAFPVISADGTLYYASKGLPGMGGYDIYRVKGEKAQWSKPENLRYPINSTSDDFYLVTPDGKSGYLSSNREGGKGSDDIYRFSYQPIEPVPTKLVTLTDTAKKKKTAPPSTAENIVLSTIYYDLDKSVIRPDAAVEMDKLVLLLKAHPQMKIELSSYTDSRASDQYNMALSQRRSAAAMDYLVQKGISPSRLVANYYGETNLVNKCADGVQCTEEEQQLNRRTEFKVIAETK